MSTRTTRKRGQTATESPKKEEFSSQANDDISSDGKGFTDREALKRKMTEEYYCEVCEKSCNGPFVFADHIRSAKHNKKLKASGTEEIKRSDAYQNMVNEVSSLPVVDDSQFHKCEICNVTVTGASAFQQHTAGIKHYRNMQKQEILNQVQVQNMDKYSGKPNVEQDSDYCCTVCDKTFSGPLPYRDHLKSKKHTARIEVIDTIKERNVVKSEAVKVGEEFLAEQSDLIGDGDVTSKVFEKSSPECTLCNKKFSGIVPYIGHIKSKSHVKKKLLANLAAKNGAGDDASDGHVA